MSTATDAPGLQAGAEGPATGLGAPVPLDVVLTVCPLSIVPDGEEFLVGVLRLVSGRRGGFGHS